MNAIEIEEAVSNLAAEPCDLSEFPFAFLEAFGNKAVTIKKLRATGKSSTNKSDVEGGVLQRLNIHIAVTDSDQLDDTLSALRESPQTAKAKAKYILATDGDQIVAEEIASGEVLSCEFSELGNNFGFFLTLAGISAVREVKDNPIDIKATSRLNKLYVELLKSNPDWATVENQIAFNQFLARLVFCFFAEDTGVFTENGMFSNTVSQMTDSDGSNTHEVLKELFEAMDSDPRDGGRKPPVKSWADKFPYVNGGLFSGATDCPVFTRAARSYLLRAGELDWQAINPDIFGSMIQAVADDEERGSLGMHYTSVPNIEKVLNPLILDSLNEQLEAAGDNPRKLLNLRKRLASIRVFDPACGSGNFLVIAYIRMREIEAGLMKRRGEPMSESLIKLTQFYGIEIKPFAVEVARLSLLIAEFQCNVRLIGQMQAQMLVLPLHETGYVVAGNALRINWEDVCTPSVEAETYICGNPPFKGSRKQKENEKEDLSIVFSSITNKWKNVDYVGAWLIKAAFFNESCIAPFSFVTTNSLCQGQQVHITWSLLHKLGFRIRFAHTSFKWSNLAANKAGVTVVVTGIDNMPNGKRMLFSEDSKREVNYINPYLTHHDVEAVPSEKHPLFISEPMLYGIYYSKSAALILDQDEKNSLEQEGLSEKYIKKFIGSSEFISGKNRYCLWIEDADLPKVTVLEGVSKRIDSVRKDRLETTDKAVNKLAIKSHQFREFKGNEKSKIFIPIVSSENREYYPVGVVDDSVVPTNKAFYIPNGPMWAMAIISTKLHLAWIDTICGRLEMRLSYSNTLGWNTFPLPKLTEQNKTDLSRCAEDILLARETHFPMTISDLYKPEDMPADLRAAHDRNDEIFERIYIGRRFKNDTERLDTLFKLYTEMTEAPE